MTNIVTVGCSLFFPTFMDLNSSRGGITDLVQDITHPFQTLDGKSSCPCGPSGIK